jgi:hypothetical protein
MPKQEPWIISTDERTASDFSDEKAPIASQQNSRMTVPGSNLTT